MTVMIERLFRSHPRAVGESWWAHARVAGGFGGALAVAALGAFVHALVPGLCEHTASRRVAELNARLQRRHTG